MAFRDWETILCVTQSLTAKRATEQGFRSGGWDSGWHSL